MKLQTHIRIVLVLVSLLLGSGPTEALPQAQEGQDERFVVSDSMIPMRDGVRLHSKIFVPKNQEGALPFILVRTPYGTKNSAENFVSYLKAMADEGSWHFTTLRWA